MSSYERTFVSLRAMRYLTLPYRLEMSSFDTQPPRNLDDIQLHPTMIEYPPEMQGITEMTFTLARCQITSMYRCMADARRLCGNTGKSYAELTPQERVDWIEACQSDFSERFLQSYSPTNAFHWVSLPDPSLVLCSADAHSYTCTAAET